MPVRKFESNVLEPDAPSLEARLVQEWTSPQEDAAEPVFVEQKRERHNYPSHLYVIWDSWSGVDPFERSVLIMRASEATHDQDSVLYVTAAEGLNFEEARRLGIRYE